MLLYRGVNLKEAHLQVFVRFTFAFLMHFLFVGLISLIDLITFKIIITQFEVVLACRLLFSTRKLFFFFFTGFAKRDLQELRPGSPEATALLHLPPASVATKCRWVKQSITIITQTTLSLILNDVHRSLFKY